MCNGVERQAARSLGRVVTVELRDVGVAELVKRERDDKRDDEQREKGRIRLGRGGKSRGGGS